MKIVRPVAAALVIGLAAATQACDDRAPSGPGWVNARVASADAPLGSAVVEVSGPGIVAIEGSAGSRVFTRATELGFHRVVVVDPDGGDLVFRIRVSDVAGTLPTTTVATAADTSNELVTPDLTLSVVPDGAGRSTR